MTGLFDFKPKYLKAEGDTYVPPKNGWTCFHCGDWFARDNYEGAREHFGPTPDWTPECVERNTMSASELVKLSRAARREAELFLEQRHKAEDAEEVAYGHIDGLWVFPAKSISEAADMYQDMRARAIQAEATLKEFRKQHPELVAQAYATAAGEPDKAHLYMPGD